MRTETTATRSSGLGPEVTLATKRDVFHMTYHDARSMRGVLRNEFLTCGDVEAFVSDTGRVVVGRAGDYGDKPGTYAAWVGNRGSKATRYYFLARSQSCGPVPLPR